MARIGWQEFIGRFPEVEVRFVNCEIGLPRRDSFFTVAFHAWNAVNTSEEDVEVTIYAKNVRQVKLSGYPEWEEIEGWDFTQQHPLLWDYEWSGSIVCLSPLHPEVWRQIAAQAQEELTVYNREVNVADYAARQVEQWGHIGSFALGSFPLPLYQVLVPILEAHGIRCFLPSEPPPTPVPVLFLIDGEDYIIADEFEVEVPEALTPHER